MKRIILVICHCLLIGSAMAFSSPEKINYQGVARDAEGSVVANQQLGVQIQLRSSDANGVVIYSETHIVTTNQYGLFNLQIGTGNVGIGAMNTIDWGAADVFVEIGVDFDGGNNYVFTGTSQLVSVPYALHAKNAENVFSGDYVDLTNKPESLSDFANDPGYVTSSDDADADITNEIQDLSLDGSTLMITNNQNATAIDLSPFSGVNTDEQILTLTDTDLAISGGNTVDLSTLQDGFEANTDNQMANAVPINAIVGLSSSDVQAALEEIQTGVTTIDVNDADADATNEIQDLSLVGSTLTITNNLSATEINLSPFSGTNTDEQLLALSGTDLSISNGNTVDLAGLQDGVDDADADATNELQDLDLVGNTLSLTDDGSTVDLSGYLDDTDDQILAISGTNLSISDGNSIDLAVLQDGVIDADADATNEIQDLLLVGSTLTITNNASATDIDLSPFAGANTDEQDLTLTGNTLSLTNDPSNVDLSGYLDNSDDQTVDQFNLSGTTLALSLEGDGEAAQTVNLSSLQDGFEANTDGQIVDVFTLSGTTLSLSLQNDGEATKTIDLSVLQDGVGSDDQTIDVFNLTGTSLGLSLEGDGEATQTVDLSILEGAFSTTSNVTTNENGNYAIDDLVFGSPQLDGDGNIGHNHRLFFDKSKGAFRAGHTNSNHWSEVNTGLNSVAFGSNNLARGDFSFASGSTNDASALNAASFGSNTEASATGAFSMGVNTVASGSRSLATGSNTTASGDNSSSFGSGSDANGGYSTAFGLDTEASANGSSAFGQTTTASGIASFSTGNNTEASGYYSSSFGQNTTAMAFSSMAVGRNSVISGNVSSWVATDPLFVVGNGSSTALRANALTVLKNGNIGIGVIDPGSKLEIDGQLKITGGSPGVGKVLTSDANGLANWSNVGSQAIDVLSLNGTILEISLEDDGLPTQTLELSSLSGAQSIDDLSNAQHDNFSLYMGFGAGILSDPNKYNTGLGRESLNAVTAGGNNVAVGAGTLQSLTTGGSNTALGAFALNTVTVGEDNVGLGQFALQNNTGSDNVAIGEGAARQNISGTRNISLGRESNYYNSAGSQNTIIGYRAGYGSSGGPSRSGSIFVGYQAGYNETTDNKLYIENSNSATPLIYGEFDNNIVQINGTLNVTEVVNLKPSAEPATASTGDMYFDNATKKLRVFDGSIWQDCF